VSRRCGHVARRIGKGFLEGEIFSKKKKKKKKKKKAIYGARRRVAFKKEKVGGGACQLPQLRRRYRLDTGKDKRGGGSQNKTRLWLGEKKTQSERGGGVEGGKKRSKKRQRAFGNSVKKKVREDLQNTLTWGYGGKGAQNLLGHGGGQYSACRTRWQEG